MAIHTIGYKPRAYLYQKDKNENLERELDLKTILFNIKFIEIRMLKSIKRNIRLIKL